MNLDNLLHHRLTNQQLILPQFQQPEALVHWMCAMQAQDYSHALWAIGMRLSEATEASVEQALIDRKIVRSWIMRGTFHICHAGDIHWLLDLLGSRVIARKKSRYRQLELNTTTLYRAMDVLSKVLQGGKELERKDIGDALQQAGISPEGQRLYHIIHHAALEKLICLGKRRDKQFTYTLLDEYLPAPPAFDREWALAEIAKRFFLSRGPASFKDFTWWSGLTVKDAKAALEMAKPALSEYELKGEPIWGNPKTTLFLKHRPSLLLPAFDEYVIPYQDRSLILNEGQSIRDISHNGMFHPLIIENGKLVARWKRTFKKASVKIEVKPLGEIGEIANSAQAYGQFLNKTVELP